MVQPHPSRTLTSSSRCWTPSTSAEAVARCKDPSMPPSPLLPGCHPDPSIVVTDQGYFLVTSTFEYLPGLPVYQSTDLEDWELVGHVATRSEQLGIGAAPTGTGVYAPTIRFHDGRFHVV